MIGFDKIIIQMPNKNQKQRFVRRQFGMIPNNYNKDQQKLRRRMNRETYKAMKRLVTEHKSVLDFVIQNIEERKNLHPKKCWVPSPVMVVPRSLFKKQQLLQRLRNQQQQQQQKQQQQQQQQQQPPEQQEPQLSDLDQDSETLLFKQFEELRS
jgi:hypothetical protein